MNNPIRDEKMRRILRLGGEEEPRAKSMLQLISRDSHGPRRTTDRFDRITHLRFFGFRIVRNR